MSRPCLASPFLYRALRGLLLLTIAGVLAMTCAPRASASVTTMFGFNEWNDPSNYSLQPQLNMPVRRMLMGWNVVQPTANSWDWGQSDAVYTALLRNRLRPLIVIQAAPCWANTSLPCGDPSGVLPPDPSHYGAWAKFIARLAARYPAAIGIEIWNEENIAPEWAPYPNPAAYTQVLQAAYRAVRSVNRRMPVISGGLFPSPASGSYGIADDRFLAGMYAAGAKGFMDGIGIHPYPDEVGPNGTLVVSPSIMEQVLNRIRTVRDKAGAGSTPLWITEMGVSMDWPGATQEEQAADLLTMLTRARADGDIKVALIHRLVDQPIEPGDPTAGYDGYGVFNSNGTPKLAACELSLLFRGSLHCPGVTLMRSALCTLPSTLAAHPSSSYARSRVHLGEPRVADRRRRIRCGREATRQARRR